MKFQQRILELCRDVRELSQYIGVKESTVYKYCSGKAFPRLPKLMKIADFYSVSVDYLLGRDTVLTSDWKVWNCKTTFHAIIAICANCGNPSPCTDRKFKYCPNCGARMENADDGQA